jgi:hypothetical protein
VTRIRTQDRVDASAVTRRNGQNCPRCKRFGTFAPNTIVCDRCMGALPLVFTVTVTVVVGGDPR